MVKALLGATVCNYFLALELLPVLVFANYLDINQITAARQVNAAVVNVSGRQRMLSQRSALLCMQLVHTCDPSDRTSLRSSLSQVIELMAKSHNALINGDPSLHLTGEMSAKLNVMYFKLPVNLDCQIREYIVQVKALLQLEDKELTPDNHQLRYILKAADDLLTALDLVVSEYEQESDAEQLAIDLHLAQLYQKSRAAEQAAQAQALQLEQTLHQLQKTQTQLIHTEKMSSLGQLVAGVAHEINNPVNFITNNLFYANEYVEKLLNLLHIYQQNYPQPTQQIQQYITAIDLNFLLTDLPKVISSMKVGTDRISEIVCSLRNFSRNDHAKKKPVDIHEGIENTLLILQHRLKASGKHPAITLIKDYGNLPLVECYPGQLNQVFMNIISNAIDALETQNLSNYIKPRIAISTQILGENAIAIKISDNGPGMTDTVKMRLFDPFFTTKDVGKGTGLGLSISYQIVVEKHGGNIKCTSTPGAGTEFWIDIPIRQESQLVAKVPA